jgi:DNA primase
VALAQYGVRQAVATLGTATSTVQVERLFQVTANVIFCFDGDRAGRAAAARALEAAMPAIREGRQARFLFLPEGEDPDSLVRKEGAEAFRERLRQSKPLSELFFEQLMSGIDMNSMDGRARLAEKAAPGLRKLPPGIFREMMLGRLAELTKVDARQVEAVIAPSKRARAGSAPQPVAAQAAIGRRPLRLAIALLLQRPALAALAEQPERYAGIDVPGLALLAEVLTLTRQEPGLSTGAILERFRDSPYEAALWKLAAWEHQVPEAGIENEFRGVLGWLDRLLDEKRLQYLDEKLQQQGALTEGELREWQALLAGKRAAPQQS